MFKAFHLASIAGLGSAGAFGIWLSKANLSYTVGDALKYSGFKLLDSNTTYLTNKKCLDVINKLHLSVSFPAYTEARKYCVKPRSFLDMAKGNGLIVIGLEPNQHNYEKDVEWLSKVSTDNPNYKSDWAKLTSSSGDSTTTTEAKEYQDSEVKSSLSNLDSFNDEEKKERYVKTMTKIINSYSAIQELKKSCWALGYQTHNEEQADDSWYLFLKYCTRSH